MKVNETISKTWWKKKDWNGVINVSTSMRSKVCFLWMIKVCYIFNCFTGNEEDFIIISIVRTLKLGFLKDLRRTNVMLSRCKKGMFIVSKPHFLTEIAKDSLIGQFVNKVVNPTWLTLEDVCGNEFLGEWALIGQGGSNITRIWMAFKMTQFKDGYRKCHFKFWVWRNNFCSLPWHGLILNAPFSKG